jgi:hypothetical protein
LRFAVTCKEKGFIENNNVRLTRRNTTTSRTTETPKTPTQNEPVSKPVKPKTPVSTDPKTTVSSDPKTPVSTDSKSFPSSIDPLLPSDVDPADVVPVFVTKSPVKHSPLMQRFEKYFV